MFPSASFNKRPRKDDSEKENLLKAQAFKANEKMSLFESNINSKMQEITEKVLDFQDTRDLVKERMDELEKKLEEVNKKTLYKNEVEKEPEKEVIRVQDNPKQKKKSYVKLPSEDSQKFFETYPEIPKETEVFTTNGSDYYLTKNKKKFEIQNKGDILRYLK